MNRNDGNVHLPWDYLVKGYYLDLLGQKQRFRETLSDVSFSEMPKVVAEILRHRGFQKFLPDTVKLYENPKRDALNFYNTSGDLDGSGNQGS